MPALISKEKTLDTHLKRDHRRRCPCTLGVLDDPRRSSFHDRHAGVRRSQIDADDVSRRALAAERAHRRA